MSTKLATVIDFAATARARKVRLLVAALKKFTGNMGPASVPSTLDVAKSLTPEGWQLLESIAGVRPSSETTRQLVIEELESRLDAAEEAK